MIRGIACLVLAALSLGMLGCAPSHEKEMQRIGGIDYCIPKENRRDIHIWWIPKELPEGGSLFGLPVKLENGVTVEITGLISDAKTYPSWKGKPAPDSQWWKELSAREGRRLVAGGRYIAAASQSNYSYLVWSPGHEAVSLDDEYTDKSQVIADCLEPKLDSKKGAICDRVIHLNFVAVSYTFDANLIGKTDWLDKKVTDAVNAWRCPA